MVKIKLIIITVVTTITMYQALDTYSICREKQNIQMIYEVKQGENINTVAKKFGTTTEKLQKLNNWGGLAVEPGDRLKID